MFELNSEIKAWRQGLKSAGITHPAHLDELENHLREAVARKKKAGLADNAALTAAREDLGHPEALLAEFNKTARERSLRTRRRAGIITAGIFSLYGLIATLRFLKPDVTAGERISGLAAIAVTLAGVWMVWQILPRCLPVIRSKGLQSAIGLCGGISGAVWMLIFARFILPQCDFAPGQLLVASCWAFAPAAIMPAIGFMVLDKAERPAAA